MMTHKRTGRMCVMADNKKSGYGRNWKKWLIIYAIAGVAIYLVVYLVFFANLGGGGGKGLY